MEVYGSIEEIRENIKMGSVISIGNFDGVHVGHRALIEKLIERANSLNADSVLVTFEPHPLKVIAGKRPPVITPLNQKLELLEKLGVGVTICLKFTKDLANISAKDFVTKFLLPLRVKEIIIGYDYRFGKNRQGDYNLLKKLGKDLNFEVIQVEPVYFKGEVVSSTRIRTLVQEGKVREVVPMLNRYYQVYGKVVEGHKRGGRLLGIPTANLNLVDELVPKTGVYAVFAELEDKKYKGVANVGYNPTFGNRVLSVEVHIFDFNKDIYGQDFRVHFVDRIRSEKKFSGIEELKSQILKDIEKAKEILKNG
ncbi:bifunctional riboflavin kinase/FAD synthetase [Desulfothermus okinawensis JCM 13304]